MLDKSSNPKIVMKKYNISANSYDQLYKDEQTTKKQKILTSNIQLSGIILDVGCGTGLSMIDEYPVEYCVGLDISIGMLKFAKNKGKDVVLGDMTLMPFRDKSFNFSTSITSFHHAPKKIVAINEILRVTKIGGYIIISLLKKAKMNVQTLLFSSKELKLVYLEETDKDLIFILLRV